MPYCPRCGAEYTEGIATCHECGVALVAERPERVQPGPPTPGRAVSFLSSLGSRFVAGFGYAGQAARLLWRRPGLLWLPMLVVLFNAAEITTSNLLYFTATTQGRDVARTVRREPEMAERIVSLSNIGYGAAKGALTRQHAPVQGPELRGTRMLITNVTGGRFGRYPWYSSLWLWLALSLILSAPLIAWFRAGYYGMLRAVIRGEPGRGLFWTSVRARYWAFLGYEVVLVAADWAVRNAHLLVGYSPSPIMARIEAIAAAWAEPVILLLLALGFVAITLEGVGTVKAVGRSARTVVRDFPVLLVLAVTTFVLLLPANTYGDVAFHRLYSSHGYLSPFGIAWGGVLGIAIGALNLVIGVWLALAQFLWYRAANPAPMVTAVEEGPSAAPAEA